MARPSGKGWKETVPGSGVYLRRLPGGGSEVYAPSAEERQARLAAAARKAAQLAEEFLPGQRVRLGALAEPAYLVGVLGEVVGANRVSVRVRILEETGRRFSKGATVSALPRALYRVQE